MIEGPIKATIYCIVEDQGRILLTEDEGKPGWKLPGGEVKRGELLLEAAKREVKEETGFEAELTSLVSLQEYLKKNKTHRLRIYLTAKLLGGKEKLMNGEVKRIKWFTKEELRNLKLKDFFIEPYFLAIQDYLQGKSYPLTVLKEI